MCAGLDRILLIVGWIFGFGSVVVDCGLDLWIWIQKLKRKIDELRAPVAFSVPISTFHFKETHYNSNRVVDELDEQKVNFKKQIKID